MGNDPGAVRPGNGGAGTVKAKRVRSILSFADNLQKQLQSDHHSADATRNLLEDVKKTTRSLHDRARGGNHGMYGDEDLDQCGTALWNLCVKLRHKSPDGNLPPPKRETLLLSSRVLAFLILDLAQWSEKSPAAVVVHLMKLALKAGRCCVDEPDLDLSVLVLQRAAIYDSHLQDLSRKLAEDEMIECDRLHAEYLVLRTAQSWREDRLDVAEHMFRSIETSNRVLDAPSAEKLADMLFEIGKGLTANSDFPMAVKWLQRAYDVITGHQLDHISRDGVELRLAISQALTTALLRLKTPESFEKAQNLANYIESEIGDKLVVLLLRLEILSQSPAEAFDCEAYASILRRMIRTFGFSEANFRLIIYHARKLHDKSPGLGCSVLDQFLLAIHRADGTQKWVETLVVTRILMANSQRDCQETIEVLRAVLDKLDNPLSAEGTVAAQTIIWGRIEFNYNQGQYGLAEEWSKLGLHNLFRHVGPQNTAKLERKLLFCAMSRNDLDLARSAFYSMSETARHEPMTQYLMYKVSVQNGDRDLASECLEAVSRASANQVFLYACVIDSQRAHDKTIAVEALKRLVDKYEDAAPNPVHLPALLRCTIRLLHTLLVSKDEDTDDATLANDLCNMFEETVSAIRRDPKDAAGNKLFDIRELEWFCQNAYNLGLKNADAWNLRHVVRILTACENIIRAFPLDVASPVSGDLSLKAIFCHFVISSALVSLARTQDNTEARLQDYLDMRKHIAAFDAEMETRLDSLDEVSRGDLLQKLSSLLVFDFEGATCLMKWEELNEIVHKASSCRSFEAYEAMGDCLLRAGAPVEHVFSTMRTITNEMWVIEDFNANKLARYYRCLLRAVLPSRDDLGEILLREVCKAAREASEAGRPFPAEEVSWMATTVYNHGLEWWSRFETDKCEKWAEMAINLAHYCDDEGHLEDVLHEKYAKLKLGE